jgi:PhnB protein
MVKPKPDGYPTVIPYLIVRDGAAAIEFYRRVLGARERLRIPGPNGRVGHAELDIGDSVVMLADESPESGAYAPTAEGRQSVTLHLYVDDADAVAEAAERAGARIMRPVATQFYGDRIGAFADPFGHVWHVSTHVEDFAPEELERRAAAASAKAG